MHDAAGELGKLTQFYFNVVYVVFQPGELTQSFKAGDHARQWLASHGFPVGYVMVLPSTEPALGIQIDEMRAAGWTTLKTGIGRTKQFAEVFLQRRLEAVMVPEPSPGEVPRKAKVAKEWKDVRKKL